MFKFMFDLVGMCESEGSCTGDTFDLLKGVMGLTAQTSLKASQCFSAVFVANRVALRELVLDKFDSQSSSREALRGSSFASKELFGPLPDSLKTMLSAPNGERFMFTPKSSQPCPTPSTSKRQAPSAPPPPKRRKTSPAAYALQRPQSAYLPASTPGTNFRRPGGKSRGKGFQKKRGGYS